MYNPFEVIEARLNNIETLLLDLKHPTKKSTSRDQDLEVHKVESTPNPKSTEKKGKREVGNV